MMLIIKCPKLLHYLHNYDKLNHQISICWQFDSSVSSWEIGNEMEMKVVLLYLCCWRCSSFSTLCRPITGEKCKKAPPRKVHKAEREKLKRDHLNDFFVELGNMLGEHSYANILSFRCFRVHVCWIAVWCFWTAPCCAVWDVTLVTRCNRAQMHGLSLVSLTAVKILFWYNRA